LLRHFLNRFCFHAVSSPRSWLTVVTSGRLLTVHGPCAILPLKGRRSSIVWTETTSEAERPALPAGLTRQIEVRGHLKHR
jgi:hypothetical protein